MTQAGIIGAEDVSGDSCRSSTGSARIEDLYSQATESFSSPLSSVTEQVKGSVDTLPKPLRFSDSPAPVENLGVPEVVRADITCPGTAEDLDETVETSSTLFKVQELQAANLTQASRPGIALEHIYPAIALLLTHLSPMRRRQQQSHQPIVRQRQQQARLPSDKASDCSSSAPGPSSDQPLVSYADWRQERNLRQTRLARANADLVKPRLSREKKSPEELRAIVQQADDEYKAWKTVRWSYTEHELVEKRAKAHRKSKDIAGMSPHDTWLLERGRLAATLRRAERRAELSAPDVAKQANAKVMCARAKLEYWAKTPPTSE